MEAVVMELSPLRFDGVTVGIDSFIISIIQ